MEKQTAVAHVLDLDNDRLVLEKVSFPLRSQRSTERAPVVLPGDAQVDLGMSARKMGAYQHLHNGESVRIIERLAAVAEMRDGETGGHITRTGIYAGMIARGLGLPEDYVATITLAATVHDVGKMGINDSILSKPAALTSEEFEVVKTHTVIGEQILSGSSCPLLQMAASIALCHHERWDGSGYPYGLKGEQIPLAGRIVMLADQYDALRSPRVYKCSLDHETTCAILSEGDAVTRPEHFDPMVLKTFLEMAPQFAEACEEQSKHELAAQAEQSAAPASAIAPLRQGQQRSFPLLTVSGHC